MCAMGGGVFDGELWEVECLICVQWEMECVICVQWEVECVQVGGEGQRSECTGDWND